MQHFLLLFILSGIIFFINIVKHELYWYTVILIVCSVKCAWVEKSNKRDTTDRAKRGVWDEKRGKERKKKKISIVFCT